MLRKRDKILKIVIILLFINCDNRNQEDDQLDNDLDKSKQNIKAIPKDNSSRTNQKQNQNEPNSNNTITQNNVSQINNKKNIDPNKINENHINQTETYEIRNDEKQNKTFLQNKINTSILIPYQDD
ncbi:MAG: hypothetical protein GY830_02360 [Bacteroidetes bacterium]|nr:hypothetical protein [Bacteroidota bacterium]